MFMSQCIMYYFLYRMYVYDLNKRVEQKIFPNLKKYTYSHLFII